MSNTALGHHQSAPANFFPDNMMMHNPQSCRIPDGHLHRNHQVDVDFSKGIYNLRPRSGHVGPSSPMKTDHEELNALAKQKRPRNSLKKRLLVNARERDRMRVLNNAFQALRDALPCYIADGHMAKITTLRLAINYIKALTEVLNDDNTVQMLPGTAIRQPIAPQTSLMMPPPASMKPHFW